ncbi:MAG: aspartyl protease family protein [Myxococcota bacterium]|nr:aspartyl protease family protein [Myxococcota bacterium]
MSSKRAALRFELGGRPFPLPIVRGTVAGESAWMVIDTGANSHILASWLARKAGLALRPRPVPASDHAGRAVSTYSVTRPAVAIEGWGPLNDAAMLVTDVPEAVAAMGIGAFLSPQWLASLPDGLVLDLRGGEMRTAPWTEAVAELGRGGGLALGSLPPAGSEDSHDSRSGGRQAGGICVAGTPTIPELSYVLPARVGGHPVDLLLDTGSSRTDLLTTSDAARTLARRAHPSKEPIYAASGLVDTLSIGGLEISVGAWSAKMDVDLVAVPSGGARTACPRDGVLGMDALVRCVLVLGRNAMAGWCEP